MQAYFYKLLNEISNSHVTEEISELASLLYSGKIKVKEVKDGLRKMKIKKMV